ncbi:TniQ family protein [Agrobacterium vitis]|uniref:TniQ family protein n=1 Tax=Agrobacterium vitis TaxID=373 RepID=UPI0012E9615A|nr:TniQ family protein [Agrobacterium vitis]MVA52657.1 hypothetical protein [Agrobacterium vitis]MVA64303.1 hypothetical protein [Agrobacterium vitis]
MAGRLPVAPRPYRDEFLSSWLARVACRYGLTAQELVGHFADDGNSLSSPLPIDDWAPAQDQTGAWARACGIDPERLERLALARRYPTRSPSWFTRRGPDWSHSAMPGPPPVCLDCFTADRVAGRNAYLRASWMLGECCICPAHSQLLCDRCSSCRQRLFVKFYLRDGCVRPVCRHCACLLDDRGGEGGPPRDRALIQAALVIQRRVAASIDQNNRGRSQLEKALTILWAPLDHAAAARPALALWFGKAGWRCPYEVRHAVGADAPLGRIPVRWRFVTLLALDDIFGVEPNVDDAIPAAAAHVVRRATTMTSRSATRSLRQEASNQAGRRSSEDYDRLARNILAHPDWIAAEHLPARKRQRLRARLVDAALARNSSSEAGFLLNRDLAGKLSSHVEGRGARFEGENEP